MDIIERLRVTAEFRNRHEKLDSQNIIHEAADEILRLRKVLQEIADNDGWCSGKALEQFAKQHLEKGE